MLGVGEAVGKVPVNVYESGMGLALDIDLWIGDAQFELLTLPSPEDGKKKRDNRHSRCKGSWPRHSLVY